MSGRNYASYVDRTKHLNDEYDKMPRAVYQRCIWLVRDIERLLMMAEIRLHDKDEFLTMKYLFRAQAEAAANEHSSDKIADLRIVSERTIERACRELTCIYDSLQNVPVPFRREIIGNIVYRTSFSDAAHPNTWKKWKRIFIYDLAKKLNMI